MSMMTEYNTRPEDVGEILVKVQEDLLSLREKLMAKGGPGSVDITSLENAIQKTEEGIKSKTDVVIQQLNNRVMTLPSLDAQPGRKDDSQRGGATEAMYDLRGGPAAGRQGGQVMLGDPQQRQQRALAMKKVSESKIGGDFQMIGPSPGQNTKLNHSTRVIQNPYNKKNREILGDSYGIQLPLIHERRTQQQVSINVQRGSTVEPLAVLPRANRVDPQLLPPPISEDDAKKGILSLIERGLIPPAAELTLEPSPVRHKMAPLHDPMDKDSKKLPPGVGDGNFHLAGVRTDPRPQKNNKRDKSHSADVTLSRITSGQSVNQHPAMKKSSNSVQIKSLEMSVHPLVALSLANRPPSNASSIPPPTTPASAPDFKDKSHRFPIQHGKIRDNSQEFVSFKQHYCLSWGGIVTMLKCLEKMLTNFSVPIAFINGDKLADLSLEFELEKQPTIEDLLTVIVNREDVESIIRRPGRRYMGPNGHDVAASKIQATFRMYRERTAYLEYRRKKWAAGVIAISWVLQVKMSKVRKQLDATRLDELGAFRRRTLSFARSWDRMKSGRRTIIHIPSMGYSQHLRQTIDEFSIWQNLQMSRLCDIKDPNVDVIYVSPVAINDEMSQYYSKLLGLQSAIDSGNVDDQTDINERYKIIIPEAVKCFPAHHMCLASHLKYSPTALKRIKNLIQGRDAYIVTGAPHSDDLYISDYLNVPMLSPEPTVAHLYSTKSGSKRIFASANVAVPPGEHDIYSLPQLHECLAQLVTENLEVSRWLFKIDDEFDGRGIAYLDIADHLRCYQWAVKEAQRYGEKWSKKWAQEAAYIKIHAEIPEVLDNGAVPSSKKTYPTWERFLEAFLSKGGVIEACPPSESVTSLTVDMLIEPNGKINVVCNGDQIHGNTTLGCLGYSVPQSSVEPDVLNDYCQKIGEAAKTRGVIGYFSMDFVTFIHPKTMRQELWAVDFDLSFSDSLASFKLMEFATAGTFNPQTHYFDIPLPKKEEKKSRRRRIINPEDEVPPNTNRFAVMSTRLKHSNLSVVHYSVFFQMCRAHGIGYDVKEKQGTIYTLVDSFNRENLGMITIGDNLQGALATFARNLSVVHQEISAPNMQGTSNFRPIIEDIEAILGTTVENAEDGEETSTLVDVESSTN